MNPFMTGLCLVLMTITLHFAGCSGNRPENTQDLADLVGCWEGGPVLGFARPPSEWRLFSWRPDSSLAISLIYEVGPRSRVWTSDIDVTVSAGRILWENHEGFLSDNKDTLKVIRTERGERSLWRFVRNRAGDSLMTKLLSYVGGAYVYRIPPTLDDGWVCSNPSERGMNKAQITKLIREITDGDHGDIHSILIAKDGKLVVEEYFAEGGTKHGSFIDSLFCRRVHHLASTTKSVTSLLVGIAIDQGFINTVEDPICRYLPAYDSLFTEQKREIRISHMLTMTPGYQWRQFGVRDDQNDGMQMWRTNDVIEFVLRKPLETEPGKNHNYTNGVPTVTGAIIKNAVGTNVNEFAEKYIFQPLGISKYVWTSYPDGSIETDGGLALRSRDLAKIGQLFLNNGIWNGKRIVSEQWVRESTKARLKFGKSLRWGYGYHWMQAESRVGDRIVHSYFVPGDGNQMLAVFPELSMVVVFTAGNYGKDPKPVYYSLFEDIILPAVVPEEDPNRH